MFLKQLDVIGFKSFAERISVDFVPGVTAVVGPNGSGKSNIIDAIRWVLGEQSAKSLRGAKMEDVIFGGSDSRKPLNFAEVTLTLDNSDGALPIEYSEVSVTRRVFRSGDSEYLLNKQPCRLKDIIELFMDSGLGKEAFSIISQGKVEEILNSKPEERRTIFEDAAGVLKYKNRKKKAEAKLFETQENLNRVNDIISELEGQVEPLKIQASMAKDYLEKKEELEKVEVGVTVYEIEDLHKQWQDLSSSFESHGKDELRLSAEIQKREAQLEKLRDNTAALDESITQLQEVLLSTSEELEKLQGRKQVLHERKKNASNNREQLEKNIVEAKSRIQKLSVEKQQTEEEFNSVKAETENLKGQLSEKQKRFQHFNDDIETMIDTLKGDYIEKLNRQAAAKNETQYLQTQLDQQTGRSKRLDEDNEKFLAQREEIKSDRINIEQQLNVLKEAIDDQVISYRKEKSDLEALKSKYQKLETTLYQAYQFLQQAKSRKEMLEELEEDYSGFFQGVKEVLKARNSTLKGIEGAVAELVSVPKQYDKAIETALGAAMQHVVVESESHGREAISFLKKNQYGRATFLPMNVIKGKSIPSAQLSLLNSQASFVGVASDLLEYDQRYHSIVGNLLGNVIITEDLKGANALAKTTGYRYRFVTLDGDVVNPGGSMSGGASKQKKSSLLSRKSELEELIVKLRQMEEKTGGLEEQIKQFKSDISFSEKKLEDMRLKGEQLRYEEQEQKSRQRELELSQKNMDERLSLYDLEKGEFSDQKTKNIKRIDELKEELGVIAGELQTMEKEIEDLTNQKNTDKTSKEEISYEISELKAKLAARYEQLNASKSVLGRINEELQQSEKKKKDYEEDLQWLANEMDNDFSGEAKLEEDAEARAREKQETASLISSRRDERMKLQTEVEDEELHLKELKRQHKGLLGALKDEEVKINRLDVELENRLAHLREEYMLSFEAAKEDYPLSMDIAEARKKVKLIKLALEELGTVNLGAIDEYERVSERYQFLLEQQADLQEAKDTLHEVIKEMDTEMVKRFDYTFHAIKAEFEGVFSALFGGGRAELKLTTPDDLLNTGVDIVAQPPGKKLQNLGLLSGGERALTAIALLFSILKVRPVPFCILDEVEAALDEANVQRFSKYLKKFSQETQFIVITHRKGTMEEAHVLYGVTMQESGVSMLVSVRLEETKEFVQVK
ncbi:chromosome segregation protein SMC [Rossellomorea vietnamensis]|uniref:Chromosome partition protein Smc n=1 Tax=Rossellomorea vietnamensis TaxID=218284 RepID=A0A5D4ME28_9BACI|nr:chromosome segregation protein SMC [Rossellomorea vietnamensis]TYS00105.1 chromosome segregation protein SMC [Rossellomorea vietnamensis]